MRLIGYYAWHSFINVIKKMFKSTFLAVIAAIIIVFVFMGMIGGVIGFAVSKSVESTEVSSQLSDSQLSDSQLSDSQLSDSQLSESQLKESEGETSSSEGSKEEDSQEDDYIQLDSIRIGNTAECDITYGELFEIVIMFVIIGFIMWGIYSGTKKGSDIFILPDVNFLFPAPMRPQSVMMFRLVFQLAGALVASLYMLGQIPNLVLNVGLGSLAIIALIIGWLMLLLLSRVFSVFTYTVSHTYERIMGLVFPITLAIGLISILPAAIFYSSSGGKIGAIVKGYTAGWLRFIPVVGWYKGMIGSAFENNIVMFLVYMALMILSFLVMFLVVWHIKADFYESALAGAQRRQELLDSRSKNKPVKEKRNKKRKPRGDYELKGDGASAFFYKEILVYRRESFAGIISNSMLLYTGTVAAVTVFLYMGFKLQSFLPTILVLMVLIYIRSLTNLHASETITSWLMLVPDNPYKKVMAIMGADSLKLAIELIPGLVGTAVFAGEKPLTTFLWYLTFLATDFMLSTVRTMIDALVPVNGMDVVKSVIQMTIKMFVLFIMVVVFAAGYLIGGIIGALIINLVISLVIGGLLFAIYPSMLHSGTK